MTDDPPLAKRPQLGGTALELVLAPLQARVGTGDDEDVVANGSRLWTPALRAFSRRPKSLGPGCGLRLVSEPPSFEGLALERRWVEGAGCSGGRVGSVGQACGFESLGPIAVELPPGHLALSERQDRRADELDFLIHVFAPPVVSIQDHNTFSNVDQLIDADSVRRPRLEPVEPVLAEALETDVRPGLTGKCEVALEVVREERADGFAYPGEGVLVPEQRDDVGPGLRVQGSGQFHVLARHGTALSRFGAGIALVAKVEPVGCSDQPRCSPASAGWEGRYLNPTIRERIDWLHAGRDSRRRSRRPEQR